MALFLLQMGRLPHWGTQLVSGPETGVPRATTLMDPAHLELVLGTVVVAAYCPVTTFYRCGFREFNNVTHS